MKKTTKKKSVKKINSLADIPALLETEKTTYEEVKRLETKDDKTTIIGTTAKESAINLAEAINAVSEQQEEVKNVNNCEYYLEMSFNNETLKCYTNNLDVSLQSFAKPVLTEMFVKIQKKQSEFLKRLTLVQAKMLFNDAQSREIFLENFYGLYGRPQNEQRIIK